MLYEFTPSEAARAEFLANLRIANYNNVAPELAVELSKRFPATLGTSGAPDALADDFAEYMGSSRTAQLWARIQREGQEMMWAWATEAVESRLPKLRPNGTSEFGSVRLDPGMKMPKYFEFDFHVQPGGYLYPNSGYVYDTMVPIFYMSRMQPDIYGTFLSGKLADTKPQRILDLACGSGHNTFPWKERFPGAEVHGIDLGPSMVETGLAVGIKRQLAVNWSQMNAEALQFEDRSFDIVSSLILFHELPEASIRAVVREARRVLRPGGAFVIADHLPFEPHTTMFQAFHRWWDTHNNGEPYVWDFVRLDLPKLVREEGFSKVETLSVEKPSGHAGSQFARAYIARV